MEKKKISVSLSIHIIIYSMGTVWVGKPLSNKHLTYNACMYDFADGHNSCTYMQTSFLSYYVTQCFQHIYLATSTLWGADGHSIFGTDTVQFTRGTSFFRYYMFVDTSYSRGASIIMIFFILVDTLSLLAVGQS